MPADSERKRALLALVECRQPLPACIVRVQDFPWACDDELVQVQVSHVVNVLRRFRDGVLGAQDVASWADALEMREDVGYDEKVGELLFELSNPSIAGELTACVADRIIRE